MRLTFVFSRSGHRERVGGHGSLHLRVVEVDDSSVLFDHVDFLNARNVGDGQLLQVALQLLVVRGGGLVHDLLLPSGRTLQKRYNDPSSSPFRRYERPRKRPEAS